MSEIVGTLHGSRESEVGIVGDHIWAAKKGIDVVMVDREEVPSVDVHPNDIWRDPRLASEEGDREVSRRHRKGLSHQERFETSCELPPRSSRMLEIIRRPGPGVEQQIEHGHRVLEAAMKLLVFLISFIAHPLGCYPR